MKSSDLTSSILIVLIFISLYLFNFLVIGIQQIKDNWPMYRCNPMVMPFANIFGYDAEENFAYCIKTSQSSFMGSFMKPLSANIDAIGSVATELTSNIADARSFLGDFRGSVGSIFGNVFGAFFSIIVEVQKILVNMKHMMGKLLATMVTMLHLISGSIMTMESAWNGLPGGLVRALCFHPETQVELKNGEIYAMKDIPLNSVLKNGTQVYAVMQISNLDEKGNYVEEMYRVPRGDSINKQDIKDKPNVEPNVEPDVEPDTDTDIIVSGSHLVYDATIKQFVHTKDLSESRLSDMNCKTLACLITSDHTIPIGKWIFHDWEDNNGSASKPVSSK